MGFAPPRPVLFWVVPFFYVSVAQLIFLLFGMATGPDGGLRAGIALDVFGPFCVLSVFSGACMLVDRSLRPKGNCFVVCVVLLEAVFALRCLQGERSAGPAEPKAETGRVEVGLQPSLRAQLGKELPKADGATSREVQTVVSDVSEEGKGRISVVLPCASEGTYTRKTVQSFCDRTPSDVLQEILVVDDGSKPPLERQLLGLDERCKVRLLRHEETLGLMIAKQTGGNAAKGEFIGFFDCHVAPNDIWYIEIMEKLQVNPRRLVVPTITDLDLDTWDEKQMSQVNSKCYISWDAEFMWFEDESDFIPVISGGLVATSQSWWRDSGGFDKQMRGWGGENIDQSLRTWLCGGDIVRAKSSRVAHMWRVSSDARTLAHYRASHRTDNTARVAAAWFDEFAPKFRQGHLTVRPQDVADILELKKALKCKPFAYFLHRFRRVYRTGGVIPDRAFHLRSKDGRCIVRLGQSFQAKPCDSLGSQPAVFHWANQNPKNGGQCCSGVRQWNSLYCFDRMEKKGPLAYWCDITGKNLNQHYRFKEDGRLFVEQNRKCLDIKAGEAGTLGLADCNEATVWTEADPFTPEESGLYADAVKRLGLTDDMPDN